MGLASALCLQNHRAFTLLGICFLRVPRDRRTLTLDYSSRCCRRGVGLQLVSSSTGDFQAGWQASGLANLEDGSVHILEKHTRCSSCHWLPSLVGMASKSPRDNVDLKPQRIRHPLLFSFIAYFIRCASDLTTPPKVSGWSSLSMSVFHLPVQNM